MDIASLGIKIDTSSVQKADGDLDNLARTAANTEQAAGKVGTAWQQAGDKMGKAATPAAKVADAFKQGSAAIKAQQAELASLIGKIDPVVGALGRLDDMEQQLRKHSASGLLGKEDFGAYSAKIAQMRNALTMADVDFNKVGISAKQTAAALRGVPAQFTDIATSLQGGQNPLTVLLQQGGQLKDMFGGVGPAARAMGGYVAGLVNPFTAAAAAAAVLALAYKQGSDEATAYSKALILSGNAAGTNADALSSMAQSVGDSVSTTGAAADALNQLAGTGKIAEGQLTAVATAAVAFNEATGKAVSETVAEFAKLADDPVRASEELNKQYNYLTAAVYEQIQALQEQGDKAGAATLAEEAYASALKGRADDIKASLGSIETAWNAIALGARQAWDGMLGVGREQTLDAKIAELKAKLAEVNETGSSGPKGRARFQLGTGGGGDAKGLQQELVTAELQKAQNAGESAQAALLAKTNKEGIAALRELQAVREAGATKEEKHAKELEEYAKRKAAILAANPFSAQFANGQEAKDIAAIDAKYAEKAKAPRAAKAAPAYQDDAATKMLQSLREQGAALNEQLTTTGKLTAAEREQVKFAQLIADLKSKDILTADQKSLLANQDSIKVQLEKNAAVAAEVTRRAELNKLTERGAQLEETMAAALQGAKDQHSAELDTAGMGSKQREQIKAQADIRKQYQRFQRDLDKATPADLLGSDTYNAEVKKIKDGLAKALDESGEYYNALDKQQRNWADGASDGFNDFLDNAKDLSGEMADIVQGTMESVTAGIGDSFAEALVKGEDLRTSLQNLSETILTSVISALTQMGVQYGINAALETTAIETVTAAKVAAAATSTSAAVASTTTVAAAQAPAAAATATAWAPAAATASVASFGGAAAIGLAALIAVLAISKGFKTGGYTGNGGTSDVAGVVHGKEFVFDAEATSRIGVDNLENMRKGKVVSIGTPLMAGQPTTAATSQASAVPVAVTNHFDMRGMSAPAAKESSGAIARKIAGAVGRANRYT